MDADGEGVALLEGDGAEGEGGFVEVEAAAEGAAVLMGEAAAEGVAEQSAGGHDLLVDDENELLEGIAAAGAQADGLVVESGVADGSDGEDECVGGLPSLDGCVGVVGIDNLTVAAGHGQCNRKGDDGGHEGRRTMFIPWASHCCCPERQAAFHAVRCLPVSCASADVAVRPEACGQWAGPSGCPPCLEP